MYIDKQHLYAVFDSDTNDRNSVLFMLSVLSTVCCFSLFSISICTFMFVIYQEMDWTPH